MSESIVASDVDLLVFIEKCNAVTAAASQHLSKEYRYIVTMLPDHGAVEVTEYSTGEEAATYLRDHTDRVAQVVVTWGQTCRFVENPKRLITPTGEYPITSEQEHDPSAGIVGHLGRPGAEDDDPSPPVLQQANIPTEEDDDDELDEDDDD